MTTPSKTMMDRPSQKLVEVKRAQEETLRKKAIEEREQFEGLQVEPEASFYDEGGHREPGDTNWVGYGFDIHPQVTFIASAFLIVFIVGTLLMGERADAMFGSILNWIGSNFGWFYISVINISAVAALYFAFSEYGKIRIGGPDALPEFSDLSWYAMLLSAGIGIGLMFWSVGEPMTHFMNPSPMFGVEPESVGAAKAAFGVTFTHWGFQAWAIYAIMALALAFFAYNRGLPLTLRSVFYPILGERIYGFWGNLIDILSVIATLFGLATSLGLGVQQVASGFNYLFGTPTEPWFLIMLIAIITGFATISVVAGLDGGVKRLSEWNLYMAGLFLLFILIVGPTSYIFGTFLQTTGYYFQIFPEITFWAETFSLTINETSWSVGWTIFYWGWWLSWSPFVGMFIARISKGRTIRQFIVGVMVIPTLVTFFWMSAFGSTAMYLHTTGVRDIAAAVDADISTAMFELLAALPFSTISSFIAVVLVIIFFVTSSDSGSLVVDHLTSGGKLESPVPQRVFWACMEGIVAAVLLWGGGLGALQTAAISSGLPLAVAFLVMIYSMKKAFDEELLHVEIVEAKRLLEAATIADGAIPATVGVAKRGTMAAIPAD